MNDINKKLQGIIESMDSEKINKAKGSVEKLLNSDDGKKLLGNLTQSQKQQIMNTVMSMNKEDMKRKLNNTDVSKLKSDDINRILKSINKEV